MKRKIIFLIAAMSLSVAFSTMVMAAPNCSGRGNGSCMSSSRVGVCENSGSRRGFNFGDANGDRICDNAGSGKGSNYVDADKNGVCDNAGSGKGSNYVDADRNGICDNAGSGKGKGMGCGRNNRR